jgi:hypothetical protein
MEELIKFGYPNLVSNRMGQFEFKMETSMKIKAEGDRKVWFSMWFLGAVVTFGIAFFPMFYRLVDSRNKHFRREAEFEEQIRAYLKRHEEEPIATSKPFKVMNAKAWAASIILVVPVFIMVYLLSRDLAVHERNQDAFLAAALPERVFMPQTIPIKTYAVVTLVTLGVGVVYWLYKVVNLYNAHFKAHIQVEKELSRLLEEEQVVEHM